jgi:hypothetical protein
LPGAEQRLVEQHLRHLGGLARAGRRRDDQAPLGAQGGQQLRFDLINGQSFSHEGFKINRQGRI